MLIMTQKYNKQLIFDLIMKYIYIETYNICYIFNDIDNEGSNYKR